MAYITKTSIRSVIEKLVSLCFELKVEDPEKFLPKYFAQTAEIKIESLREEIKKLNDESASRMSQLAKERQSVNELECLRGENRKLSTESRILKTRLALLEKKLDERSFAGIQTKVKEGTKMVNDRPKNHGRTPKALTAGTKRGMT